MAKHRIVDTVFWEDHYSANLDPIEKLLFLYFLTNSSTTIAGVYQITLKKVAVETGIDKEMVEKILARFKRDDKIVFSEGWIAIRNFIKHQNQNSPKIQKGIEVELEKAPEALRDFVQGKGMDTLSHPNPNPNPNTNSNTNSNTKEEPQAAFVAELIKSFEDLNPNTKRLYGMPPQRKAAARLIELHGLGRAQKAVEYVVNHRDDRYCPSITTPAQLEDKWAQLEDYSLKKAGRSKTVFL